ncbi:hypothetical protein M409DRAFT_59240 [Zasmidium cellare ATCC 36951]|uniref:ATP synthase mitochondrial F1 complex assembly factor 2 n=1 Tax=Zasmidium cellare ATCC 36951 TaxID=1080233 RepID=A0A6A6C2L4_ZASCE|nr:uncharacterized protein M409DRAFT_59240 [Zasmidium cellare ATCC 36951]KAF2161235.1 hypothetical protein M409DRAFT_59240 [Zasmidium cellare ATCC 36951]
MDVALMRSTFKTASSLSARRQLQQLGSPSICARCLLHTTPAKEATPIAHPTVPGPPPTAPQAEPTFAQSRIARKKHQADQLRQSQNFKVNSSKPGSALSKRFWKNVSVKETDEGLQILLDTRPVRTATRQVLTLPKNKRALAASIAMEWDHLISAQQALRQHYVPLTSLVSRAIDIEAADQQENSTIRDSIITTAMKYLSTDTLLCWAPEKSLHDPVQSRPTKSLRQKQREVAEPILGFLTTHVFPGVEIVEILSEDSIIPRSQPQMTTEIIRGWVSGLPPFELAALERGILATKSLLVAVRVLVEWSQEWKHLQKGPGMQGKFGIEEAAEAATLEVLHQTEQWGEVEDTHDVDKEDLRRQIGSSILLVS